VKKANPGVVFAVDVGVKHRISNTDEEAEAVVLEVQCGEIDANDVIRYQDDYNRELTKEALEEVKELNELKELTKGAAVVKFSASWCGPCRFIHPEFKRLAEENAKNDPPIRFCEVDVDQADDLVQKFSIQAMPTFLFFKEGEVVNRFEGAEASKLRDFVQNLKTGKN
jgi:thioredoxin 1